MQHIRLAASRLVLGFLFFSVSSASPVRSQQTAEAPSWPDGEVNVRSFGARGDGVTDDSPILQDLVDRHPLSTFFFPAGVYVLHNPDPDHAGLKLRTFAGRIRMDAAAAFACDNATPSAGQCVWLAESAGTSFENLTITYLAADSLPNRRSDAIGNALLVERASNISLLNTTIIGSTGSGIWNTDSTNISYLGSTTIRNTTADGIHFENVGNGSVVNLTTDNTGDDGLAVTNIQHDTPNCGFTADQIAIHTSHARGVVTAGACDASFSNISVQNTAYSAIAVTQDPEINSRQSTGISVSQAQVYGAGSLDGNNGNKFCIDIANSRQVHVYVVTCDHTADDGVMIYNHASNVDIESVTLTNTGNNGFQSTDGASFISFLHDQTSGTQQNGFDIESSNHVNLEDCQAADSGGYGFFHSASSEVTETLLVAGNSSTAQTHHRSWWAESMTGSISVEGLAIEDQQPTNTGYVIGDYDNSISLNVSGITFQLGDATPVIQAGPSSNYYLAESPQ